MENIGPMVPFIYITAMIDINFDVYSNSPKGKDPDSYSPKIREYHKFLWSKKLPPERLLIPSSEVLEGGI